MAVRVMTSSISTVLGADVREKRQITLWHLRGQPPGGPGTLVSQQRELSPPMSSHCGSRADSFCL
jgi:hypothetical protein